MNVKGFWDTDINGKEKFFPACDYPLTTKQFIEINKIKFWVEFEGKGSPLFLIHGGPGGNHCYFHPDLSLLASKKRQLIYYDLRGHYMSGEAPIKDDYGLEQDVCDLDGLRKAMGFKKIDILAHSYGTFVAVLYAVKYPERVGKLVLCSAPVQMSDEEVEKIMENIPTAIELSKATDDSERKKLYYKLYFKKELSLEELHYQELSRKAYSCSKNIKVVLAYEKNKINLNWEDCIKKITSPLLFICGKYDFLVKPERIKKLIKGKNNIRLIIMKRSAHDPFVDESYEFARIVNNFFNAK